MAESFIEEIYSKADLITNTKLAHILEIRNQTALLRYHWDNFSDSIPAFCESICAYDKELGDRIYTMYADLCSYSRNNDVCRASDMLEEVIPLLYDAMSIFADIDVTDGDYRLFSSKSGYLSVENIRTGRRLCSGTDPMWEAYERAQILINHRMRNFCSFGCELGYLAYQMYMLSKESIDIYIYDVDRKMVDYALSYGVLDRIPEERLHIVINPNPNGLLSDAKEMLDGFSTECVFNFDDDVIDKMTAEGKEILVRLKIQTSSQRNLSRISESNFLRNIVSDTKEISVLKSIETSKEWIVVGGGPSVDYNIDYIKEYKGTKRIIAATTIYKRLIDEGIKPDYLTAIDPLDRIWNHVQGREDESIPIILSDSVTSKFALKYPGKKYLVHTGDTLISKEFCNAADVETWQVEGTVTYMCIKAAIYLGAKVIDLVGIDLSYPSEQTHAQGTMDFKKISMEGKKLVKDVNGGLVYSDEAFMEYVDSIEKLIRSNPEVEFYNLSKNGAYIAGCKKK